MCAVKGGTCISVCLCVCVCDHYCLPYLIWQVAAGFSAHFGGVILKLI